MTNGIIDSNQKIVTNGLVLHLDAGQRRSYSGTGTVWTDLSGNNNHGTLTNGPTFNPANSGSIQFDGLNDVITIPVNTLFNFGTGNFSVDIWMRGNVGADYQMLFALDTSATGNGIVVTTMLGTGVPRVWVGGVVQNGTANILNNKINNLTVTRNAGVVNIYINGALHSTASHPNTVLNNQLPVIGRYSNLSDGDAFSGNIFNVKVYNRALSDTEVLQNYNATKSRFEVPPVLDLYPNAAAAYSLRKLRSGYTGSAIRVRRSSDNTEQDIGFTSTGDLDITALTTFVGANNGFVSIWYDQSGSGNNATQTTQASQPSIITNGTIITQNDKPTIFSNQSRLITNTVINLEKTYSVFSLLKNNRYGDTFLGNNSPYQYLYYYPDSNSFRHAINSGFSTFNSTFGLDYKLLTFLRNNSVECTTYKNTNLLSISNLNNNNNFSPNNILGDNYTTTLYNFVGNVSEVIIYPTNQSPNRVGIETNINSYYGIYNSNIDSDAQSFITAAAITDSTQQAAVDALVKDLKNYGLWSKMKAIYPFVGGTASSHKFNLKDPRDVDGAFRLSFVNAWTHNSNGVQGNGVNTYANSFFNPTLNVSVTNAHVTIYLRTNSGGASQGLFTSASDYSAINDNFGIGKYGGGVEMRGYIGSALANGASIASNSLGLWAVSSLNNRIQKLYLNGLNISSVTANQNLPNYPVFLGAGNYGAGGIQLYTAYQFAFATIGDGLTDTEAANLYTAVQKYQTTLGRQV